MELIVMTTLCFVLLALPTSSAALQIQVQSSHENANELQHYSLPAVLPRKLRLFEEVKEYGGQDSTSYNKEKEYVPGKSNKKEQVNVVHGSKGTWREWMEGGADASEFYTMDYSHVQRRRPIHNKSMPDAP
ncbi:probable root meristem growth factor 8 [Fagus crenata]